MHSRTFARVKVISIITLVSVVLGACGGENASVSASTKDQVVGVSENLSSSPSSVSTTNIAAKSAAFSSKSIVIAVSTPLVVTASSKFSTAASSTAPTSQASNSVVGTVSNNQTASSIALGSRAASVNALSSRAASSIALSSKAASSIALSSRAASSAALSSKAASSKQAGALGATIEWRQPAARQNGDYLELSEIGGYQIRYKTPTATAFNYITIEGNATTNYVFLKSIIGLKFEIAVYDSTGLYSEFVTIN